MALRVLVVDDTIVFRKIISDALLEIPGVEIVGKAGNGKAALMRIRDLNPDIVTLDIEMPEMDGLEVLRVIREEGLNVGVIVLSALSRKGSEQTVKALELGAFEFVTKPESGTPAENRQAITDSLSPVIEAWRRKEDKAESAPPTLSAVSGLKKDSTSEVTFIPPAKPAPLHKEAFAPSNLQELSDFINNATGIKKPEVVLIGVSTGGPSALAVLLPSLSAETEVPLLIVQHMPPLFTQSLAKSLDAKCSITVKEAGDGERIKPGVAYIAPGGMQMKLAPAADGINKFLRITDDPPENNCKPSVDYMFRSAVKYFPGRILPIILTGMGNDGTIGMRLIKRHGGLSIVQNEESSVVWGMPMEAMKAGAADLVLPVELIGSAIKLILRQTVRR